MQTSQLQQRLSAKLAEVRKRRLASAICDSKIVFVPPQEYLHTDEITLESCLFLCVILCLSFPRGSWNENYETFQAVYKNVIGSVSDLSNIKPCYWHDAGVTCICGTRHKSPSIFLVKECPSCYDDATKPKPYYCDYMLRMLQDKGMKKFVAESYVACAITCMESVNV